MDGISRSSRQFTISRREILRRRSAFDRLAVATTVSAALAAGDLVLRGLPASLVPVVLLALLFLGSRAGLARSLDRFSSTVWTLAPGVLRRTDSHSDIEYLLESICGVRTKRTKSGTIREMRIAFDGGATAYVNAIDDAEDLRAALLGSVRTAARELEVREIVDFDAPWFYVVFGVACGVVIALMVRLALSASRIDAGFVYATCATYSLALGVYWLRAKPLSGRFGPGASSKDRLAGIAMICVALAAGAGALWMCST